MPSNTMNQTLILACISNIRHFIPLVLNIFDVGQCYKIFMTPFMSTLSPCIMGNILLPLFVTDSGLTLIISEASKD